MMDGTRGSDTSSEIKVRRMLHRYDFRFRLHQRNLPSKPELVTGHASSFLVASGTDAQAVNKLEDCWQSKFNQIVKCDLRNRDELFKRGWRVVKLWQ
jgi:DNA mismatch endonuclease (patch repair protein)